MLFSRASRRALPVAIGALLAATCTTPAVAAVQRYASPGGSGTACTSVTPCTFTYAITSAAKGDEVIVKPGDYPLTSTVFPDGPITIHGVAGRPRPRLRFSGAGQKGMDLEFGSTLRYVEIDQAAPAPALFAGGGAGVDQVIARAQGLGVVTATIRDATVRNSIVVGSGTNAAAVAVGSAFGPPVSATLRNVTVVASGAGAVATNVFAATKASMTANLSNVIAYGGSTAVPIRVQTDNSGATATLNVTHSVYASSDVVGAFAKIVDGGGNRWQTPGFVNAGAGDYREAPGSYTINAGLTDPANGAFDVEGGARVIGTTDIGADEFLAAPAAATGPAGAVTRRSATLNGGVNAHGAPTSYRFEYGPTSAYGSTTPTTAAGSGTATVAAGATLDGLGAGRTYHYRLVATNAGGTTRGADRTFTTAALPPFGGVELVSTRLSFGVRGIAMKLSCPGSTIGRCSGRATITARHRSSSSTRARFVVGRARFSIASGERAAIKIHVTRIGRRVLSHVRRLHARASNVAHDGAGLSKTTSAAVTIRRRHR